MPAMHSNPHYKGRSFNNRQGFTLVEVMVSSVILVMVFITTISAIHQGLRMLDTARNTTLAGQIIQSEIEDLRLRSWARISEMSGTHTIDLKESVGKGLNQSEAASLASRFAATRTIEDVADRSSNFRRATITVTWTDYAGVPHTRSYATNLGHFGLSDYFVVTHRNVPPPSTQ